MNRTTLEEKARSLAERKAALGIEGRDYVPVNSGARRTEAKRELLRAIDDDARSRGVAPPFEARIG